MTPRTLFLIAFSISSLLSPQSLKAETIRLCYEDSAYEPHLFSVKQSEAGTPGFLVEIINRAAQQRGLIIEYARYPWKRCIFLVQSNALDGLFATTRTRAREAWAEFPKDPKQILWPAEYYVFTAKSSHLTWDGSHFTSLTHGVGAPLGYVVSEKLRNLKALPEYHIPANKGLLMTARRRLDGYVVEDQIGWHLAQKMGVKQQLKTLTPIFLKADWTLALSKAYYRKNPQLSEAFWQAINEERQKPHLELKAKYHLR